MNKQKQNLKIKDLIKVQAYGEDPGLLTIIEIKGDKIIGDNGCGETFEVDASDCSFITEADAIAQGLL